MNVCRTVGVQSHAITEIWFTNCTSQLGYNQIVSRKMRWYGRGVANACPRILKLSKEVANTSWSMAVSA